MSKISLYDDKDPRSIEAYAKHLINKNLRQFLSSQEIQQISRVKGGKGYFGNLIEEYYFKLKPNNRPLPDFPRANVELKTAPLKRLKLKNVLVPKERLVLGIIDYKHIVKERWKTSSFSKKNLLLLLIFYIFVKNKFPIDYLVKFVDLWTYPKSDLNIIKQDWEKIVGKIKSRKAHELSEGDTFYLGACTKGATAATSFRSQVGSNVKAKQRAFALKIKYLKVILDTLNGRYQDAEPIVKSHLELKKIGSFERIVIDKFDCFIGKTVPEIESMVSFKLNRKAKDFPAALARAMLGISKRKIEEFDKADVTMKVIRLKKNGMPKESMSFPAIRYQEIINEKWGSSTFREMVSKKFFFVIFKYHKDGALKLEKVMFWNIPYKDLESEVKECWKMTVSKIKSRQAESLPRMSENRCCHVRPHGTKGETFPTHYSRKVKKQSFWLNAKYLKEQIEEHETNYEILKENLPA